jgi:hypothetical protein
VKPVKPPAAPVKKIQPRGPDATNSNAAHAAGRHKIEAETEIENAPGLTEGAQSRTSPAKPGGGDEQPATDDSFPPPHIQPVGSPTDQATFEEEHMGSITAAKESASTPPADVKPADAAALLFGASPTAIAVGTAAPGMAPPAQSDPFADLKKLRISQDFIGEAGVKRVLSTVPVRKPHNQEFIRTRSEPEYRDTFAMIELKEDRQIYLVMPNMRPELLGHYHNYVLYTCMNRQGTLFLWPARLPDSNGKDMDCWRTAHEAAAFALTQWTNLKWDEGTKSYAYGPAPNPLSEPEWPEHAFNDLLRAAFRDRLIDRPDHEVIRRLHGLV